jgi:hypothetical protein
MKKLSVIVAITATLVGSSAFAQPAGKGAAAAKNNASDDFSWGIGLGGLAILGVVVGLTVASAASDSSSFSH